MATSRRNSTTLSHFRTLLQNLDNYQLDEERFGSSNNSKLDENQIAQYRASRDEYLARRQLHTFLKHAVSVTNNDDDENDDKHKTLLEGEPSEAEARAMEERHAQVEADLVRAVHSVRDKLKDLRYQVNNAQVRKQDLERIVQEMEEQQVAANNNDNDTSMMMMLDGDEEGVSEEALEAEQARIAALQARKAELTRELEAVEQENDQIKASIEKKKGLLDPTIDVQELEVETESAQEALDQAQEVRSFYNSMREMVSKLSRVEINQVLEDKDCIALDLTVMGTHNVIVNLEPTQAEYRLAGVEFRSPLRLEASSVDGSQGKSTVVRIPDPQDLVTYAQQTIEPGEDLRFVVNEIVARVDAAQQRLEELVQLQQMALTKVGSMSDANFQEVVCSLRDTPLTVVLRLTIDCPLLPGSVTIDQIVGVGGWDAQFLRELETKAQTQSFQRPTAALEWLESEIQAGGAVIPPTPRFPVRGNAFREN